MKYLAALFFTIVPGCATFTLQSEDPRYGKIAFAYTLPDIGGLKK